MYFVKTSALKVINFILLHSYPKSVKNTIILHSNNKNESSASAFFLKKNEQEIIFFSLFI